MLNLQSHATKTKTTGANLESETRRNESITSVLYLISTKVMWQRPSGKKHANMNLLEPLSLVANQNKMTNAQLGSCLWIHRGRHSAIVSLLSINCSVMGLRVGVWKVDSNVAASECLAGDRSVAQARTTLSVISGSLGTLRRTQRTFMHPSTSMYTLEITFGCVQAATNSLLFSCMNILKQFHKRDKQPARSIWRNDFHRPSCPVLLAGRGLLQGIKGNGNTEVVYWTQQGINTKCLVSKLSENREKCSQSPMWRLQM